MSIQSDELEVKKKLLDMADRSFRNNQYIFTDFLSMADMSVFFEYEKEFSYAGVTVWNGDGSYERGMLRFGNPESFGYEEDFPIDILLITPLAEKFAENLSHRDFLGALMNFGIERDVLGDIIVDERKAYLFCESKMTEFIIENLSRVRHTSVMVKKVAEIPEIESRQPKEVTIQVASERIDGVVAKVYHLSRGDSAELFTSQRVFLNGRLMENYSHQLKTGDVVSVRGFGRFTYKGSGSVSKKGKLNVTVDVV